MRHFTSLASIPILFTSYVYASVGAVNCDHFKVEGKGPFDFSKLKAPQTVWVVDEDSPPAVYNTTWAVDICKQLKQDPDRSKDDQCKAGTNICGVKRSWNPADDPDKKHVTVENVISLAGQYSDSPQSYDHYWKITESSDDHPGGIQFEVYGGTYAKMKQRAIIDFQCVQRSDDSEKEDDKRDDGDDAPKTSSGDLQFVSYEREVGEKKKEYDTLRLRWKTEYACADYAGSHGGGSGGWGFFTWLILILFMGTAAYLVFGSWLNYNRYGARGWDLLPHGDTIRDIPYLVKDWGKKVVDTVSGPGTRGGYSAV